MSIVINSDIDNFKGKIYLPDFFTMPQVNGFNAANERVMKLSKERALSGDPFQYWERDEILAPALFACVEKLEIEKQPEHPTLSNFRFTPAQNGDIFIAKLIVEIGKLILGEQIIPNA